jgi:hypothetical protein
MKSYMLLCSLTNLALLSRERYKEFFAATSPDQGAELKKEADHILVPSFKMVMGDDSTKLPSFGIMTVYYRCNRLGKVIFGFASVFLSGHQAVFDPADLIEFDWEVSHE